MSNVQFYTKPVPVNRESHRNATIGAVSNYAFAAQANSVHITAVEFAQLCKEYPIVFAQTGNSKTAFALLGLKDNDNLFVTPQGEWEAHYLPAFVRRYPFVLAGSDPQKMVVCVDEAATVFNATDGQAMFDAQGAETPFLQNALQFLSAFHDEMERTEKLVAELDALGLLVQKTAAAELPDGRKFNFAGIYVVDEAKLMALDEAAQARLVRTGVMGLVYAHLMSLSNIAQLANNMAARDAAVAESAAAAEPVAA